MKKQRFASVWDAVEDTPEQAANMKLRSVLMTALKDQITRTGMSQAEAAQLFGVKSRDIVVIVATVVALSVTAALAGFLPARRASRVNPMIALRWE